METNEISYCSNAASWTSSVPTNSPTPGCRESHNCRSQIFPNKSTPTALSGTVVLFQVRCQEPTTNTAPTLECGSMPPPPSCYLLLTRSRKECLWGLNRFCFQLSLPAFALIWEFSPSDGYDSSLGRFRQRTGIRGKKTKDMWSATDGKIMIKGDRRRESSILREQGEWWRQGYLQK